MAWWFDDRPRLKTRSTSKTACQTLRKLPPPGNRGRADGPNAGEAPALAGLLASTEAKAFAAIAPALETLHWQTVRGENPPESPLQRGTFRHQLLSTILVVVVKSSKYRRSPAG